MERNATDHPLSARYLNGMNKKVAQCMGSVKELEKLEKKNPLYLIPDEFKLVHPGRPPEVGEYFMHSTEHCDPGFPTDAMYYSGIRAITENRIIVKYRPGHPKIPDISKL
jgi:hypothetical protein